MPACYLRKPRTKPARCSPECDSLTTMTGAQAIVEAIAARAQTDTSVVSLQELHAKKEVMSAE